MFEPSVLKLNEMLEVLLAEIADNTIPNDDMPSGYRFGYIRALREVALMSAHPEDWDTHDKQLAVIETCRNQFGYRKFDSERK